ncbi:MAG TPA: hypothetical protein VF681_12540 [Abditibacteriaceae bacterium]|jgi:hypothetical protein
MVAHFTLHAEWNQIYLEDAACPVEATADPDFWDETAMRDGMANAQTIVAVGTVRHGEVVVSVAIRSEAPTDDIEQWDHVVDAALTIPSGRLRVRGGGDAPEASEVIHVTPGVYQLRAFYGNLDVEDIDSANGDDFYNVVLWPSEWREREVIKRFQG